METLATDIRDRLGPVPALENQPLVSVVVLNRDGEAHLRRLLAGLIERTDYPHLELILVDNGSSDGSLDFARAAEAPFPISIVANRHNESFSDANNQGAEMASGELLLFLNNDIEPFEPGWLRELIACHRRTGAGAVGATLIYPEDEGDPASDYRVQSHPVKLRERPNGLLAVDGAGEGGRLFDGGFGEDVESMVLIAACLLIEPELFREVGGFTHGFVYGGEDDDLALKLRAKGHTTLYSGRAVLIHRFSSTSRELHEESGGLTRRGNRLLLLRRWGPRAWREMALARLSGGNVWAAADDGISPLPSHEEVLTLRFCLIAKEPTAAEMSAMEELEAQLARRGHRCLSLHVDPTDDPRGYLYDVAVYVRGASRHSPAPGQFNVLWIVSHFGALSGIECSRYDLAVTSDAELAARLREESGTTPAIALEGEAAAALIDATLERTEAIALPKRIEPEDRGATPLDEDQVLGARHR